MKILLIYFILTREGVLLVTNDVAYKDLYFKNKKLNGIEKSVTEKRDTLNSFIESC